MDEACLIALLRLNMVNPWQPFDYLLNAEEALDQAPQVFASALRTR